MVYDDDSYDSALMSSSEESADDESMFESDPLGLPPLVVSSTRGTETLPNSNTIRYSCTYSYTADQEPHQVRAGDHFLFLFFDPEDMSAAVEGRLQLKTRDECKPEFLWKNQTHSAVHTDNLNVRHWRLERRSMTDEEAGKFLFLRLPHAGSDGQMCAYSVSQSSLIFFTENDKESDYCEPGVVWDLSGITLGWMDSL